MIFNKAILTLGYMLSIEMIIIFTLNEELTKITNFVCGM